MHVCWLGWYGHVAEHHSAVVTILEGWHLMLSSTGSVLHCRLVMIKAIACRAHVYGHLSASLPTLIRRHAHAAGINKRACSGKPVAITADGHRQERPP